MWLRRTPSLLLLNPLACWPLLAPGFRSTFWVFSTSEQLPQTIVHLGLDLGTVLTRASLADALAYALHELGSGIIAPTNGGAVRGDR